VVEHLNLQDAATILTARRRSRLGTPTASPYPARFYDWLETRGAERRGPTPDNHDHASKAGERANAEAEPAIIEQAGEVALAEHRARKAQQQGDGRQIFGTRAGLAQVEARRRLE
jgi:hypothetical protein